jgi:hypothetical protein
MIRKYGTDTKFNIDIFTADRSTVPKGLLKSLLRPLCWLVVRPLPGYGTHFVVLGRTPGAAAPE